MKKIVVLLVITSMLLSSCVLGGDVESNEVGAITFKNAVWACVPPGNYWDGHWYSGLETYSVSTVPIEVSDPEVATKDNQLIGLTVTIQVQRLGDCESVKGFMTNWKHLLYDENLITQVDAIAREAIKNGVRNFTLQQVLDDRNGLADLIETSLQNDTEKFFVKVVNSTVENVALHASYVDTLNKTAQLKAEEDYELRRQKLIEQKASTDLYERQQAQLVLVEQLKVEKSKTLIEEEIARRTNLVAIEANSVYLENERAFILKQLELYAQIFNDKTVYFLPFGTDLNLFGTNKLFIPQ